MILLMGLLSLTLHLLVIQKQGPRQRGRKCDQVCPHPLPRQQAASPPSASLLSRRLSRAAIEGNLL